MVPSRLADSDSLFRWFPDFFRLFRWTEPSKNSKWTFSEVRLLLILDSFQFCIVMMSFQTLEYPEKVGFICFQGSLMIMWYFREQKELSGLPYISAPVWMDFRSEFFPLASWIWSKYQSLSCIKAFIHKACHVSKLRYMAAKALIHGRI